MEIYNTILNNPEHNHNKAIYDIALKIQDMLQKIPECENLTAHGMPHNTVNDTFFWSNISFTYHTNKENKKISIVADCDANLNSRYKYLNSYDVDNYQKLKYINSLLDSIIQPLDTDGENAKIFISKDIIDINTGYNPANIFIQVNEKLTNLCHNQKLQP